MVAMVPGICTHDYAYRAAKTIQIFEKIMVTIHLPATINVTLYFEVLIKKIVRNGKLLRVSLFIPVAYLKRQLLW